MKLYTIIHINFNKSMNTMLKKIRISNYLIKYYLLLINSEKDIKYSFTN